MTDFSMASDSVYYSVWWRRQCTKYAVFNRNYGNNLLIFIVSDNDNLGLLLVKNQDKNFAINLTDYKTVIVTAT